ncbi:hypothetical protein J3D48_006350 [Pseudomonas fluorescens]|uniref:YbjN domain-containing protein n=1 Tax=Pseudomonas fluorescens TaxID=294 RepID=UPI00209E0B1F|nr:YbjN domain-containing protein [Pseudomonas fluorescens]MCP1489940.1 hypothetical protein [Pseudomonas fluorescens]
MTQVQLIDSVTPQSLTETLQSTGFRVTQTEESGGVQLLSASQGIGYSVRFGSAAMEEGAYLDFTFSCVLRVQGELPRGTVEFWNASRRFASLTLQGEFLSIEMDVMVKGGVSPDHLRNLAELWDRMIQELVVYLREYSQHVAQLQAKAEKVESPSPRSEEVTEL